MVLKITKIRFHRMFLYLSSKICSNFSTLDVQIVGTYEKILLGVYYHDCRPFTIITSLYSCIISYYIKYCRHLGWYNVVDTSSQVGVVMKYNV